MPVEADAWEKMRPLSHIGGGVGCPDVTGPRVRGWFSFKQSTLDAPLAESGREIIARSSTRISLSAAEISASDWLIFHWLMAKYARDIARLWMDLAIATSAAWTRSEASHAKGSAWEKS